MKNRPEREELLNDLLGSDLRAASLHDALAAVRRARQMRRVRYVVIAVVLMLGATTLLLPRRVQESPAPVVVQSPPAIRMISDDELLARFPGRAIALVGPPEHRQLIFLDVAR